jgi:hypothetical protein
VFRIDFANPTRARFAYYSVTDEDEMAIISDDDLIDMLRSGLKRTKDLIAHLTEYHGGPVLTEYLLTGDLAREFVDRQYEVKVECLNRSHLNVLTATDASKAWKKLKARRTDISIVSGSTLLALIEVKIGVRTLQKLKCDLDKIACTLAFMSPRFACDVIGAAVFQVHISGGENLFYVDQLKPAIGSVEQRLAKDLDIYARSQPGFSFELRPLQGANEGIVGRDIETEPDGEQSWGQYGHATRYYAIVIKSIRPVPRHPTFEDLAAANRISKT